VISGQVDAHREPRIQVTVRGPTGQQVDLSAVVDTGFTGWLTLPPALIGTLALPKTGHGRATLADGRAILFEIFDVTVVWDGTAVAVAAEAADTDPLVGMLLLDGFELRVQAVPGGTVTIEALP
jgi:clan AA aspartic protease